MVLIAISPNGILRSYLCKSNEAVNKEVYSIKCVKKKLFSFIQQLHNDENYLFWQDLASNHYAHLTIETFNKLGITYV